MKTPARLTPAEMTCRREIALAVDAAREIEPCSFRWPAEVRARLLAARTAFTARRLPAATAAAKDAQRIAAPMVAAVRAERAARSALTNRDHILESGGTLKKSAETEEKFDTTGANVYIDRDGYERERGE